LRTEQFLRGTEAEGIITAQNPRGSDTVLSIVRNSLIFLSYLDDPEPGEPVFSIRDWVANDDDRRWIWLPTREDVRAVVRPLIALIFDLVPLQLLTLNPSFERRIWVWLEELPTLPPLSGLHGLVTKGRKYGGCWCLVVQDPGQLAEIYGIQTCHSLLQNCATWVLFRANNAQAGKFLCEQIGLYEEVQKIQTLSVGTEQVRDGATYAAQKVQRAAVLPSELQSLPDLQAYLLLHGPWPRARVTFEVKETPTVTSSFLLKAGAKIPARGPATPEPPIPEPPAPEPPASPVRVTLPSLRHQLSDFRKKIE